MGLNALQFVAFSKEKIKLLTILNYINDKISKRLQSNIVYFVKCLDCEVEYARKINQHTDARIYQHKMIKDG